MELIFFKDPIIGILALLIIALDIFLCFPNRKFILTALDMVLHTVCLTLIMLRGGGYEGALMLVLMSSVIILAGFICRRDESEGGK